jgi:transposase-like protein
MGKKPTSKTTKQRRVYSDDLKAEAVQMLFDGHSAVSVAENLGINGTTLLYRWKNETLKKGGPAATALDSRVQHLEEELRRTERERDILKKPWPFSARRCDGGLQRHRAPRAAGFRDLPIV